MIAAKVNISERYLHQLLDEEGLTFTHLVRDLRLDRASAMLLDPKFDHLHISQIAYDSGFNDLSYFSRSFRSRFGDTPSGMRAETQPRTAFSGMSAHVENRAGGRCSTN
jgi:AraC-like DNA-binding protein